MRMVPDVTAHSNIPNIDIVTAGDVLAGIDSQRDVIVAGQVARERVSTDCRVVVAGMVAYERKKTGGRVPVAGCVAIGRSSTGGRVVGAGAVGLERANTAGRVVEADCVELKSACSPMAVFDSPVVLKNIALDTGGRVAAAGGGAKKRLPTGGCVGVAECVAEER